jgi:hypothetical protein
LNFLSFCDTMVDEQPALPEDTTTLGGLRSGQRKFCYCCDFGDECWQSNAIEKLLQPDRAVLRGVLLAARPGCPPKGCAGVFAYADPRADFIDPVCPPGRAVMRPASDGAGRRGPLLADREG